MVSSRYLVGKYLDLRPQVGRMGVGGEEVYA